jgi:ATP-dependent Lhr-like helicase
MLISANGEMRANLQSLMAVVVDEIHAFAGDDRGWHLISVVERLVALAGHELQRIGLSATVGNPDELMSWLAATSQGPRTVVQPPAEKAGTPAVTLDHVGSLENAALVVSRLHRGEKRLVFCDSRSRVESLAGLLRSSGIQAFVSHSSISAPERLRAEEAFARGDDCVIIATSTLELGIDVGDLDRVIQIDAPARVASFLQRLGRTGRRAGKSRNCLFLCTTDDALLQGAALLDLWAQGYVEPILPPPLPYHIVAQQALALCLQHGGIGRSDLLLELSKLPLTHAMERGTLASILDHLVQERLMETDGIRYFIGEEGQMSYGRRHFLELLSVFTSPPVLAVTDGRSELGMVDQGLFQADRTEGKLISLAGRGWRVQRVDWKERRVYVSPSEAPGKTVWLGASRGLSMILCRSIRKMLTSSEVSPLWSQRATERLGQLRDEYSFLKPEGTTLLRQGPEGIIWFTFAGDPVNSALGRALASHGVQTKKVDDYAVAFSDEVTRDRLESALAGLNEIEVLSIGNANEEAEKALKFADCVPAGLLDAEMVARRCAAGDVGIVLGEHRAYVEAGN